jgi:hypothetical protein
MGTELRKQGTIWGVLLVVLGVMVLAERLFEFTAWLWAIVLAVAAVVLFAVWLVANHDRPWKAPWAPLISAYVLAAVAVLVAMTQVDLLDDLWIAPYVLAAIALPFLIAYVRDRKQWWALIPAYVLLAIGLMVFLTDGEFISDELVAPYVLFVIAIPFFVVFVRNTQNWWALIPGGILAVIGLSFLIAQAAVEYIGAVVLVAAGVWIVVRQFTGAGSRDEGADDEPQATVEAKVEEPPAE